MPKNFNALRAAIPAERRIKTEARVRKTLETMQLHELRRARKLSQTQLAAGLSTGQGEVSKIENRTDMHLSTLQKYVEAMGGRLEMRAVFPDTVVPLELTAKD